MGQLFNLRMMKGEFVAQHINELSLVTSQPSLLGIKFGDEVQALILLHSLLES